MTKRGSIIANQVYASCLIQIFAVDQTFQDLGQLFVEQGMMIFSIKWRFVYDHIIRGNTCLQ